MQQNLKKKRVELRQTKRIGPNKKRKRCPLTRRKKQEKKIGGKRRKLYGFKDKKETMGNLRHSISPASTCLRP